jgi:hypothetical protein
MTKDYQDRQLTLFTDSFFTSPTLLVALQQRGIRLCGSVRRNRKGMAVLAEEEVDALSRGEWTQRQKGDMTLAVWKDQRTMWVLYNHCSPRESSSLDRWGEADSKVSIGCPRAIRDYFHHSRSVDVINQLHYNYLIGRKARRCWPRLAWWLLDMCIVNAFKLWSVGQGRVSQLDFREQLMLQLMEQLPAEQRPHMHAAGPRASAVLAKDHYSLIANVPSECIVCSDRSAQRKQTRWTCSGCGKHMCAGECFHLHHSTL